MPGLTYVKVMGNQTGHDAIKNEVKSLAFEHYNLLSFKEEFHVLLSMRTNG